MQLHTCTRYLVSAAVCRQGSCSLPPDTPELQALAALMARMEHLGAAPLLGDGAVGGNCGILVVSRGLGLSLRHSNAGAGRRILCMLAVVLGYYPT
jgi:hypothetical protein